MLYIALLEALALLMEYSPKPSVHGFHLSHNYFSPLGVGRGPPNRTETLSRLLLAAAARSGSYPAPCGSSERESMCVPRRVWGGPRRWKDDGSREIELK